MDPQGLRLPHRRCQYQHSGCRWDAFPPHGGGYHPVLEKISAHVDGEPCCAWMGTDGAGHFVKMVHNGIEYADMQFIGEAHSLLRAAGLTNAEAGVTRILGTQYPGSDFDEVGIEVAMVPRLEGIGGLSIPRRGGDEGNRHLDRSDCSRTWSGCLHYQRGGLRPIRFQRRLCVGHHLR
jgi:hypothetical protein